MDPKVETYEESIDAVHQYIAQQYLNEKTPYDIRKELMEHGMTAERAKAMVDNAINQLNISIKKSARKSILWGSIWFSAGLIATFAGIGFIFWGAILFGFVKITAGLKTLYD